MYKYLTAICLAFSSMHAAELPTHAKTFLSNHAHNELNLAFEGLKFDDATRKTFIETYVVPWLNKERTDYPIDPADSGVQRGTSAPNFDEVLFQTVKRYLPSDQSGALLDYACGHGLQSFLSAVLFAVKDPLHFVTAVDPYMTQSEFDHINNKKNELEAFLKRDDLALPLSVVRSNIANLEPMDQKFDVITFRDAAHLFTPRQMRDFFQEAFTRTTEDGRLIIGAITGAQFYSFFNLAWHKIFPKNTPEDKLLNLYERKYWGGMLVDKSFTMTNFTKLFHASQAAGWILEEAFFTSKTPESQDVKKAVKFGDRKTELSDFEKLLKGVLDNYKPGDSSLFYDRVYLIFQKHTPATEMDTKETLETHEVQPTAPTLNDKNETAETHEVQITAPTLNNKNETSETHEVQTTTPALNKDAIFYLTSVSLILLLYCFF